MFYRVVELMEKKLSYGFCFAWKASFQMIANGERKFLPLSLFRQLWQDLLCSSKKNLSLAQERSGSLSQY